MIDSVSSMSGDGEGALNGLPAPFGCRDLVICSWLFVSRGCVVVLVVFPSVSQNLIRFFRRTFYSVSLINEDGK